MERTNEDTRLVRVQMSARAAGKGPSSRRGFGTFRVLSNRFHLETPATTTDEGTASSGDNICEETKTLLPAPRLTRSNPMTPPPFDPSFQNQEDVDSASVNMGHRSLTGSQIIQPRDLSGSSLLLTSRSRHHDEDQNYHRSTPQSVKEWDEFIASGCQPYCSQYASTHPRNSVSSRGVCCEDVMCDHENSSCTENPPWNNHFPPEQHHTSAFSAPSLVNGVPLRGKKLPKAMTSSLSTTTGQCDHVTTRAITVETVASSGRYKSQGVSANFVSCLSQGTCVDCGLPEDPLPGGNGRGAMTFLDFYRKYGSKDSVTSSKRSFNCESLMILIIISTLTCLATLLMGALSYLFLMKNY